MLKFDIYLTEDKSGKNLHLVHLQDRVLEDGIKGARDSINFLQALRDMLSVGGGTNHVNLTVKWDGCLDSDTIVVTNEGEKTLKEIFESWHSNRKLYILAKDELTTLEKFVPILNALASKSDKTWVEIFFKEGTIICTEDHEIKTTNRGWVRASDLTSDDDVESLDILNSDGDHHI